MKYALLLYSDPAAAPAFGTPEMDAEMQEWFAFTSELQAAGKHLGGEALTPTEAATTIRVRVTAIQDQSGSKGGICVVIQLKIGAISGGENKPGIIGLAGIKKVMHHRSGNIHRDDIAGLSRKQAQVDCADQ